MFAQGGHRQGRELSGDGRAHAGVDTGRGHTMFGTSSGGGEHYLDITWTLPGHYLDITSSGGGEHYLDITWTSSKAA